jgi:hypothetical protein
VCSALVWMRASSSSAPCPAAAFPLAVVVGLDLGRGHQSLLGGSACRLRWVRYPAGRRSSRNASTGKARRVQAVRDRSGCLGREKWGAVATASSQSAWLTEGSGAPPSGVPQSLEDPPRLSPTPWMSVARPRSRRGSRDREPARQRLRSQRWSVPRRETAGRPPRRCCSPRVLFPRCGVETRRSGVCSPVADPPAASPVGGGPAQLSRGQRLAGRRSAAHRRQVANITPRSSQLRPQPYMCGRHRHFPIP